MFEIFILLVLFQLKHFICDYPLQNAYMLGKANATGWIKPLATHAGVHAIVTHSLVIVFSWFKGVPFVDAWCLATALSFADFVLHFIVDRIKASPTLGGRWNPSQPKFWWALGADQMAHHLINYVFTYLIVTSI